MALPPGKQWLRARVESWIRESVAKPGSELLGMRARVSSK